MSKTTKKNAPKFSPAFLKAIDREFAAGSSPAKAAAATKTSVHVVAPLLWKRAADQLGPLAATPAAILAARKSGQRREIVALRASVTVAKVREIETARNRKPIYVGRGTRRHLTAA